MILGYLIGSISPAIIISRKKFKTDVREHYSKNAGATNSSRVMGKKWGIIILFSDSFKPMIAVLIAWSFTFINISDPNYHDMFKKAFIYFSGLAAIIGHCWPIFFGFRGGKGAASSLGLLLIINPIYCIAAIASWWLILFLFRMVSLSSISMMLLPFGLSWIPNMPLHGYVWPHDQMYHMLNIIIALTWIIVIIRHYSNLIRIFKGTERKVTLFDRKHKKP